MGNTIKAVVAKVSGAENDEDKKSNPSLEEEMKDQVDSLQREAEADSVRFYNKIKRSTLEQQHLIPISKVLYKYTKLEILTETNDQDVINQTIDNTLKEVTSSSVSGVISTLMGAAIQSLFGKKSLEYAEEEGYTISLGLLGGIERFDYRFVRKSFSYQTWTKKLQSVVSMTLVVSSCDIKALKQNDTKVIVQNCFSAISATRDVNGNYQKLDPAKANLVNQMQLDMHTLLTYQIELAQAAHEVNLDEEFKLEETLIFAIDKNYRQLTGLDTPQAVSAVQHRIKELQSRSLATVVRNKN